jgi:hypothetical protein
MALANEVLGHLDLALQWAMLSFTKHGIKSAKAYANILRRRIADQQILENQMKGVD